jgi:hypothetical protein
MLLMSALQEFSWSGEIMMQTVSNFEERNTQLRHMLPTNTATARASDLDEPWERIAMNAIDGGYIESADEFVRFVDACLRYLASEQVMYDRDALAVRNLADAIARLWASANSSKRTPTTNEIAGLLQSEWVTLGHFRSLRSAIN